MVPRRRGLSVAAVAFALLAGVAPARAAIVGSIFSSPTTGDPASIYWNPAAMTLMRGTHGMLFGALSLIRLHYQPAEPAAFDKLPYNQADVFIPKPGPLLGVVTDATLKNLRFGLGVTMPIIDGATWPEEVDGRPSPTRYYAKNARLIHILIEPSVAWRINRYISIGAGVDVIGAVLSHAVMTDFGAKINQMVCQLDTSLPCSLSSPFSREDPLMDAPTTVEGTGWGVGGFGGVLVTPAPWLRIGVGVHSGGPVTIPADLGVQLPAAATAYIQNLGIELPPLTAAGEVKITMPMIVTAGVAANPIDRLEISADFHWMNYSSTSLMLGNVTRDESGGLIGDQVLVKARDDAYLVGLLASYRFVDRIVGAFRFEYEANTRPGTFTSPVSVDFHKLSIHVGLAWRVSRWLALTAEYGHYFIFSRTIEVSRFVPNANPTTPEEEGLDKPSATGRYSVEADRFGVGVQLSF